MSYYQPASALSQPVYPSTRSTQQSTNDGSIPQANPPFHPAELLPVPRNINDQPMHLPTLPELQLDDARTIVSTTASHGITPTLQHVSECGLNRCRNIVATVNLDCRLDLKTIALHARNAEYNPRVRNALPTD
jgi:hypothetical protein